MNTRVIQLTSRFIIHVERTIDSHSSRSVPSKIVRCASIGLQTPILLDVLRDLCKDPLLQHLIASSPLRLTIKIIGGL